MKFWFHVVRELSKHLQNSESDFGMRMIYGTYPAFDVVFYHKWVFNVLSKLRHYHDEGISWFPVVVWTVEPSGKHAIKKLNEFGIWVWHGYSVKKRHDLFCQCGLFREVLLFHISFARLDPMFIKLKIEHVEHFKEFLNQV